MERFDYLFQRYVQKTATPAERLEFQSRIQSGHYDTRLKELLAHYFQHFTPNEEWDTLPDPPLGTFLSIISDGPERAVGRRWTRGRVIASIAAVILAVIAVALYIGMSHQPEEQTVDASRIKPGSNHAVLELADGTVIDLSSQHEGVILSDTGLFYNDGTPLITGIPKNNNTAHTAKLSTPKGGQYRLTLPDGTTVWLNAASSLTYPSQFEKTERVVELTGEAYFEVAKPVSAEPWPFVVETADQRLKVLGTKFNVSAYPSDGYTKTILQEGTVEITPNFGSPQQLIPNQQAVVFSGNNQIHVNSVDAGDAIAWINGLFYFDNTDIEEVLQIIGRWYNVEVLAGDLPEKKLDGILPRDVNLSDLMTMISETCNIEFKLTEQVDKQLKTRRIYMSY